MFNLDHALNLLRHYLVYPNEGKFSREQRRIPQRAMEL